MNAPRSSGSLGCLSTAPLRWPSYSASAAPLFTERSIGNASRPRPAWRSQPRIDTPHVLASAVPHSTSLRNSWRPASPMASLTALLLPTSFRERWRPRLLPCFRLLDRWTNWGSGGPSLGGRRAPRSSVLTPTGRLPGDRLPAMDRVGREAWDRARCRCPALRLPLRHWRLGLPGLRGPGTSQTAP